jgi:hypothetical protein
VAALEPPEPHQAPLPGFPALWQGQGVTVTAVLKRTVVVEDATGYRHVVLKADVLVDPAAVRWYLEREHKGATITNQSAAERARRQQRAREAGLKARRRR